MLLSFVHSTAFPEDDPEAPDDPPDRRTIADGLGQLPCVVTDRLADLDQSPIDVLPTADHDHQCCTTIAISLASTWQRIVFGWALIHSSIRTSVF